MLSRLLFAGGLVAGSVACAGGTSPDNSDATENDIVSAPKPIREAIRASCTNGAKFDFFYDDASQLRGTRLGTPATELAVVKPDQRPMQLASVGGDDTVLRGADGPFYVVSRFFPRFITADADFARAHNSIKVFDNGTSTDVTCTPQASAANGTEAIARVSAAIPIGEYQGHGRTHATLCSTVVTNDGGKLTIAIKPRRADGSLGNASSTMTLASDSSVVYDLTSADGNVTYLQASNTNGQTRAVTVDKLGEKYRVSILSFGANGASTNYCDME